MFYGLYAESFRYWCEFYKPLMLGPVDPYYDTNPAAEMALQAGDVVLMDTRVMHCGGKNQSLVFLFSVFWGVLGPGRSLTQLSRTVLFVSLGFLGFGWWGSWGLVGGRGVGLRLPHRASSV